MVTIHVDVNYAGMSKQRVKELMPVIHSVQGSLAEGSGHKIHPLNFAAQDAKVRALDIIRAVPEAKVELRKGDPSKLTELTHREAPKQLGTLLRTAKFAENFGVRLVPDVVASSGVLINGKIATPEQVKALDIDWQVAFGYKNTKVTKLLVKAEARVLGDIVQIKEGPATRELGFDKGIFSEIRTVLAGYDLPAEGVLEGWPV